MNVVLWLVGLFVLAWAVLLPFSIGTVLKGRHPSLAIAFRLESLAMLIGLILWQLNEPARLPIVGVMLVAGFVTGVVGTSTHNRDERGWDVGGALGTLGGSYGSSVPVAVGSGDRCEKCHKPLSQPSPGIYGGDTFFEAFSKSPYACKTCGTTFCVDCMSVLRERGTCPACKGSIGWEPAGS